MDFGWSSRQDSLYEQALRFARERLQPVAEPSQFMERWHRLGEFGLLGLSVPEVDGGMGLDAQTTARVFEAFGLGADDAGLTFAAAAHLFACVMPIADHAREPLKARLLPRLCSGAAIGANAITESEAGSDVFALRTRAVRDGDSYVLTGVKSFVTNGPIADVMVVYASTAPEDGYLGISAFLVEKGTPGLRVGARFEQAGLRSAAIAAVYLDECRVPADHLLGEEGQGAHVFRRSMLWERCCLFALDLGRMQRQLDRVIAFARERRQFGRAIGKNQAVAHRIVDMRLRLDAAQLLLYRACWIHDRNQDAATEIALSKLAVSEAAIQSSLDAIQIHGGAGVMTETGIESDLRDALPSTIFSGTSEIQRDIVARGLGL